MELGLLFKKILTLTALVDPFLVAPLFIAATAGMTIAARAKFARQLGITVTVGLLLGGFVGMKILSAMGISLASMRFAGGVITMLVALAMVTAREENVKMSEGEKSSAQARPSLVPLGIPLLVGPAALSYVMATSHVSQPLGLLNLIVPPVFVGLLTWGVLEAAARTNKLFSPDALSVLERVAGFLLAAIAVEMMASSLRDMFPALALPAGA